ncbi:SgcJ/EcaC family oxidoreductase [Rhodocytophaga aerolata]|uniref:SgcJ/EcaC family oxidoreductase n=1 Tax=Rhodocytophaga aerolata TaxID=455078 RepID=A0ABT8RBW8_9BACT|nr:SgcJ/EcaC family oxidoreductase [Rhodocytophaga aerolata]MDO1449186.1 SgcJ/EcaC family oxidoreductase [Rhodocytophaga aerolata]
MKKSLLTLAIIASMLTFQQEAKSQSNNPKSKKVQTTVTSEKAAIEKLIYTYQDALNASDVNKVISLYTTDGVLMANAAPTAERAEGVKGTYQYVFDNFTYSLKFTILEIEVKGNTAFARSTSQGSFVIKKTEQKVPDENRELFVFEKVNGQWKIARYMYNKTK